MIVGISGPAGVGKTTAGDLLAEHYGWYHTTFAEPIRAFVAELMDGLDGPPAENKEELFEQLGVSRRQMYQTLGTEWGRQMVHQDLWVLALEKRIARRISCEHHWKKNDKQAERGVVISDVRFPNEALWVRRHGGIVMGLTRSGVQPVRAHVSEAGVSSDLVVPNDGTTEELLARLRWEVEHWKT